MSATKNNAKPAKPAAKSASDRGLLGSIANQLRQRLSAIVALVAVAGIAWAAMLLWQRVRSHVAAQPDYQLDADEIQITPPPPWIRADVRAEALHNAGLAGGMSILDDDLIERIHKAFLLHPWVAQVSRVSKRHPAHVDVELVYRRPVAMVAVPGGLYPVDVDGVLLPTDDFTRADAQAYPRLAGVESTPLGMPGSAWGDTVVAGGAENRRRLGPDLGRIAAERHSLGEARRRRESRDPGSLRPTDRQRHNDSLGRRSGQRTLGRTKTGRKTRPPEARHRRIRHPRRRRRGDEPRPPPTATSRRALGCQSRNS